MLTTEQLRENLKNFREALQSEKLDNSFELLIVESERRKRESDKQFRLFMLVSGLFAISQSVLLVLILWHFLKY